MIGYGARYNGGMPDHKSELNDQQCQAVEHTSGPLLILAGAGSGKTKTLTHRIAHLINQGTPPPRILAVTFTNKAAGEMRERVEQLVGANSRGLFLGTFHSLGVRILRESGTLIGVPANFVIFDSADQLATIKQAMKTASIDEKQAPPRTLLHLISSAKNELLGPTEYAGLSQGPLQKHASTIYPLYQRVLADANALDFDDLLMRTVALLRNKETGSLWAGRFDHLLVDEYQDTNAAQYQLIKLLLGTNRNICVVGDDDQAIYSWRGADYRTILNFERDWPDATIIKLEQNYRSTKRILDAAHQIITKNRQRSGKKLWTSGKSGEPVRIVPVMSERHEGEVIIARVKASVDLGVRHYRDFAVLYRTNAQSRSLEETFVRYGLPYRIIGGTRFYERKEVKDVLSYLRFIYQPSDRIAFERLINVPARGVGAVTLAKITNLISQTSSQLSLAQPADLLEALQIAVRDIPKLSQPTRESLSRLALILGDLHRSDLVPSELIHVLVSRIGYLDFLDDGTPRGEERIENVKELISVAREYDQLGMGAFLEEVALMSDIDSFDAAADAVVLMTLHAAKGLEFPVVFMTGMEEGIFPHSRAQFEPEELEEERRLCYVGMTRAREELYLIHASSRMLYGTPQTGIPSRFLADIEGESAQLSPRLSFDTSGLVDPEPDRPEIQVQIGDRVRHATFGTGTIQQLDGETATIEFASKGTKRLNLAFAPLEKLS
jgi:DNA helicase-2/ATP-dependent DNA helicase PcrA